MRKKGDEKWLEFPSQSKAERKIPGLYTGSICHLLAGRAPRVAEKFEVRLVSNEQPISQFMAFDAFANEIGLRHDIGHAADLKAAVSEFVPRVVLPRSDKEAPKTWKALLEYVTSLSSRDQRVLVEQTRRAAHPGPSERALCPRYDQMPPELDQLRYNHHSFEQGDEFFPGRVSALAADGCYDILYCFDLLVSPGLKC